MTFYEKVEEFERTYWRAALDANDGCVSAAAKVAGVNRTHAYKALDTLGVRYTQAARRGSWIDPDTGEYLP